QAETTLPVSIRTAPLMTGDGPQNSPVGVVAVLEDLSEIKAFEAERRRLDRLAALGEMSAVVAHEIRNPIASIAAGVEYLTRNIPEDTPDAKGVAMIHNEIERVNHILEDILFVARPFQLDLNEAHLADVIATVIQLCQPQIQQSNVTILVNCAENMPAILVDHQRLEQVFTNLIINATQAMSDGGELAIDIQTESDFGYEPVNAIITITDTGPGVPKDIHWQIFEPFFTTKARGTGLGLAVARRIIEEHRGTITMVSEAPEGEGTRFIIKLPFRQGE
ncbi:MAG: ATP-binding protein, partial [Chloroflexota bacterium]